MATEVEIKLAFEDGLQDSHLNALVLVLKSLKCNSIYSKKELKNAYFDTPDFSLNQHKVALRIRQFLDDQGEPSFIQTFKTAGKSKGGLSKRGEWEWYLSKNELDASLLQACDAWPRSIHAKSLVTLFETNFTRFSFELTWGNSLIELVLDWGNIISKNQRESIHEIELELKQGSQEDLKSLAKILLENMPLHTSDLSKAERGVNLFQSSKEN